MEELIKLYEKQDLEVAKKLKEVLAWEDSEKKKEALRVLTEQIPVLVKTKKRKIDTEKVIAALQFGLEITKLFVK